MSEYAILKNITVSMMLTTIVKTLILQTLSGSHSFYSEIFLMPLLNLQSFNFKVYMSFEYSSSK